LKRMSWLVPAILIVALATVAQAQRLDGIAAVVNDDVVLRSDIEEQLALLLMRAQQEPDSTMLDTLRVEILNQLIDEKLIVSEAKRLGLTASDGEIAKELDKALSDVKQRFGGDAGFREQLAKENTTEEKLREKYREDIRRQMIANKLMQRTFPAKKVTAAEAEAYFASNRAKFPKLPAELKLTVIQIPVVADSVTESKAKAKVAALRKRVAGGEKFAKVAGEASEDPATARNGGDLGFLPRGVLDPELDDAAFSLKIGELSAPVRSSVGWHIVEVIDRDTVKTRAGRDSVDARGRPALEAHVRHILVRVPLEEADAERARKLADKVHAEARKGGDFAALVKRYSRYEGPASGDGDLGFVSLGSLQPNIRAGLDSLPVGGISAVLPNAVGFNIFKVTDRKAEREYELAEIKQELPDVVTQMKQREKYREWIQGLRTKAHIEIRKS